MSAMPQPLFDTLRFVERLQSAGVPEPQAKAEVEILRDVLAESLVTSLAGREDIRSVREEVRNVREEIRSVREEIHDVRKEIHHLQDSTKTDLLALEQRMTIRLGSMLFLAVGAFYTLTRLH